jgi:hypothetical protein
MALDRFVYVSIVDNANHEMKRNINKSGIAIVVVERESDGFEIFCKRKKIPSTTTTTTTHTYTHDQTKHTHTHTHTHTHAHTHTDDKIIVKGNCV